MIVLSLFDGMSCGQIALERAEIKVDRYFASEIDKYAIAVTQYNYPDTIQMGDINNLDSWDLPPIDLIMGGSPCQGFSFAGKQLNFEDERSKLFFKFVDALKRFKPKYFLLENVRMKKEYQDVISNLLGVEPILINSSLLSAQNRVRLYWTNIPNITQPKDKGLVLKDIIEDGEVDKDKSYCIDANYFKGGNLKSYFEKGRRQLIFNRCIQVGEADLKGKDCIKRVYSPDGKSPTLNANSGGHHEPKINIDNKQWRKLTPLECERLQTVNTIYEIGVSLCLDQVKNYVNAVEKNHKLQKLVLSVGNDKLQESVKIVDKNIKLKNQQTKSIVQRNADTLIQKQTRKCTKTSQKEQPLNVDTVEKKTMSNYQGTEGGFATLNVFTNLIQEKIIHNGEVELHLKDRNLPHQKNGNKLLKMYGKEIMELVEVADIILEKQEIEPCIYTTLYHLNIKNIEQILITLYWFAKSVIDLSTLKKIKIKNILLNYEFEESYTLVPFGKRMMSNSQRYKMLGNGWTVDVISHIFKNIKE